MFSLCHFRLLIIDGKCVNFMDLKLNIELTKKMCNKWLLKLGQNRKQPTHSQACSCSVKLLLRHSYSSDMSQLCPKDKKVSQPAPLQFTTSSKKKKNLAHNQSVKLQLLIILLQLGLDWKKKKKEKLTHMLKNELEMVQAGFYWKVTELSVSSFFQFLC